MNIPRVVGTTLGIGLIALAALIALGAVRPATAVENELSISQERVDCDTARVTVGYRDLVDTRSDKVLRVFVDADGDGVYPATANAVIRIEETGGNDSDASIWSEQVPAGANVLARLREDNNEGPNPLLDEDEIATPDADCPAPDLASVTVRKVVENISNDPTNFNIDVSGGIADIIGIDENDTPVTRDGLAVGAQVILTEYGLPAGYEFVSWVCESDLVGADWDANNADKSVAILPRAGEDFFCIVTNKPTPPAPTATAVPPAATSVPAPVATVAPQTIIVPAPQVIVNVPPAPTAPPAAAASSTGSGQIRPPNTGSGACLDGVTCNSEANGATFGRLALLAAYGLLGSVAIVFGVRQMRRRE